ncbi:MAG: DUF3781 domain-containing protein [Clostridia bacterium]|nr:DUF3781 domain-containing protein [Clostridia bacterium]
MRTNDKNELLKNLDKLKITLNGAIKIRRNLGVNSLNAVEWCKTQIMSKNSTVRREGKNYYVKANGYEITINASSFTIITAHTL